MRAVQFCWPSIQELVSTGNGHSIDIKVSRLEVPIELIKSHVSIGCDLRFKGNGFAISRVFGSPTRTQ